MNYYKLAMQVFNKHKSDFIRLSVKRQKLKQRLILYRNYGQMPDPVEIAVLRAEIKGETERLNELIRRYINGK